MDLIAKGLNILRDLQVGREFLDGLRVFVFGGEQAQRDRDLLSVSGIDHGRMALDACLEGCVGRGVHQGYDLAAPAESDNAPGLDVGVLLLEILHEAGDFGCGFGRSTGSGEEFTQSFTFLWCVRWVPVCRYYY